MIRRNAAPHVVAAQTAYAETAFRAAIRNIAAIERDSLSQALQWQDWIRDRNQRDPNEPRRVIERPSVGRFGAPFPTDPDSRELRDWARRRANVCRGIIARAADFKAAMVELQRYARSFGIPVADINPNATGATDPGSLSAAVRKLGCARWWKRTARTTKLRQREARAIRDGRVHRLAAFAVSDDAIAWRREAMKRNADLLESLEAVRESDGLRLDLGAVIAGSLANPRVRKAEIGLRARALEETAERRGWIGFAVHLTCPSRFHARIEKTGKKNPAYAGKTPREGQAYLRAVWEAIRLRFSRKVGGRALGFFGLRSAEPHHDGTPHWHMLIFCAPDDAERAQAIIREEALRDTPDERGAAKHRVRVVPIDNSKGSATGYILKYILKGVPGGVHGDAMAPSVDDETGQYAIKEFDAASHAERIVTWAWLHGIRQFQTFGKPARMAEWRELRRIREPVQLDLIEPARAAADVGDLAEFIRLGELQPLRLVRETADGKGFHPLTAYGERAALPVLGVGAFHRLFVAGTRRTVQHKWHRLGFGDDYSRMVRRVVKVSKKHAVRDAGLAATPAQSIATRIDRWTIERKGSGALVGMESAAPWTRVNNCTGVPPADPDTDSPPDSGPDAPPDWWEAWFPGERYEGPRC